MAPKEYSQRPYLKSPNIYLLSDALTKHLNPPSKNYPSIPRLSLKSRRSQTLALNLPPQYPPGKKKLNPPHPNLPLKILPRHKPPQPRFPSLRLQPPSPAQIPGLLAVALTPALHSKLLPQLSTGRLLLHNLTSFNLNLKALQ